MTLCPCLLAVPLLITQLPAQTIFAGFALHGCAQPAELLTMAPASSGAGVDFHLGPTAAPVVLVVGASTSPTILGIGPFPLLPCVLLPAPDLLLLAAPGPGPALTLPVPAGTPPLDLWVQGVVVAPTGLLTTHAFTIHVS